MMSLIYPVLTSGILCSLGVNSYQNCYHKEFVQNTAEDNLLFGTGLLVEVNVSHRAECVSLSHLHDGCNLIVYNPSTALCRLHHYKPASQAGTGSVETGWTNLALQCAGSTAPNCNDTSSPQLHACQACFFDNAWKVNDMCNVLETNYTNTGGDYLYLNLDFDLKAGAVVKVRGSVHADDEWVGVCLEDKEDSNSYLCVDLLLLDSYCDAYTETNDDTCEDVMPQVDPSDVTFTLRLTNTTTKFFVDDTYIIQYQHLVRMNRLNIFGFGDVDQVEVINTPDSCNQP